mmetsp:Transcript_30160/g.58233  ORF Transcript_30160/g.58233 Transcript_30160/m.58233 type:complete len:83 (-) Transcript_30160:487-735(-)
MRHMVRQPSLIKFFVTVPGQRCCTAVLSGALPCLACALTNHIALWEVTDAVLFLEESASGALDGSRLLPHDRTGNLRAGGAK